MPASCKSWFPVTILCLHWGVSRDLHCINHARQQVVIFPIIILGVLPRLQISSRGSWGEFVRWAVALLRIYTCTRYDSYAYVRSSIVLAQWLPPLLLFPSSACLCFCFLLHMAPPSHASYKQGSRQIFSRTPGNSQQASTVSTATTCSSLATGT